MAATTVRGIYRCSTTNWAGLAADGFNWIDNAITRLHSLGLTAWEFIVQDFGPCADWVAPLASDVDDQMAHWQGAGAQGYWVYAYDQDPTPCAGNVTTDSTLQSINTLVINPTPTPSPSTTPSTKPDPHAHTEPFADSHAYADPHAGGRGWPQHPHIVWRHLSFGDATCHGNLIDHRYPVPAVGLTETPTGSGYGRVTAFRSASLRGRPRDLGSRMYSFGDAGYYGNLIVSYTP